MTRTLIPSVLIAGLVVAAAPSMLLADQRPRNPGGSGGSSGGSSGGTSTGSYGVPRGGSSDGGTVVSRPSEPSSGGNRTPTRVRGGGSGGSSSGGTVPPYSRPRGSAPVTGYGVERGTVATLPPIISGPIYWGPNDWYFYPWGYGGLGLGYFWDPWMWSGYFGGWGGYPWADPYGVGGYGGVGGGGYGGWDTGGPTSTEQNPLDENLPTGGVRLKATPRDAEVFVDGYYAGRVDDFDGARQKLKITRGPHRIELRAPGYESVTFDITIIPGESTTYKTDLKPLTPGS